MHQKPTIASLEDMQANGIHYLILIYFKYQLYIICISFVYIYISYLSICLPCCHVAMLPAVLETPRQAYTWLKDNTAEDARVMAWWDYGYQIAGIANRTTIADGNTWSLSRAVLNKVQ